MTFTDWLKDIYSRTTVTYYGNGNLLDTAKQIAEDTRHPKKNEPLSEDG